MPRNNESRKCGLEDCDNLFYCKNLCKKHYNSQWRKTHLEHRKQYKRKYYHYNREAERIRYNRTKKIKYKVLKLEIFTHYSGGTPKCACCGETIIEFLSIDHINNDGAKQRRENKTQGIRFYYWIKQNNYPNDLQVLCMNCNFAKGKFGSCPHLKLKEVLIVAN